MEEKQEKKEKLLGEINLNTLLDIRKSIRVLKADLDRTKDILSKIKSLEDDNNRLKTILCDVLNSYNHDEKIQYIPVDIYLDTNEYEPVMNVLSSVNNFLESIDFKKALEFDEISGSWYKKLLAKSKMFLSEEEVAYRLKEAEYGLEVNAILKPQSEIDKNQSEALLNILKSVENVPNAAIKIGSLIVIKVTDVIKGETNVEVRSLSILELHVLNKHPELLRNPIKILSALTEEISKCQEG